MKIIRFYRKYILKKTGYILRKPTEPSLYLISRSLQKTHRAYMHPTPPMWTFNTIVPTFRRVIIGMKEKPAFNKTFN